MSVSEDMDATLVATLPAQCQAAAWTAVSGTIGNNKREE
jgi:hypothetical protein